MKIIITILLCLIAVSALGDDYIVIAWNDLGMHCSNKDFSTLVVLPPYNNIRAQVIRVGDGTTLPEIITDNISLTYEIPNNTYSIVKTNFWDYEDQIFGVSLPDNIGLTGVGLSGDMSPSENYFHVEGVPITPFTDTDLINEDPFQLGLIKVFDQASQLLASTQPVVPVSNEINCVSSGCHSSEQAILNAHAGEAGFDPNDTPILCAGCHSSNALGTTGQPGLASLSEAIHKHHGERTNDCYKCHPGPNTQCFRGVMEVEHNFVCQDCHGTVKQVGESISDGREPWFDEPSCGDPVCHGAQYAEEPGKLFRESKGHGGLFCSACHGEPHAIVPSGNDRDNLQNETLQGYAGTLGNCATCHGTTPNGAGPHGISVGNCCIGITGNIDGDPDEIIDITDLVYLVDYQFRDGPAPVCMEEADLDGDGIVDISDLVYMVDYQFRDGFPPVNCLF